MIVTLESLRDENERLRQSNSSWRQVVDALPAIVGYIDLDKTVVYSNRLIEQWYQRPLNQIVGVNLTELFDRDHFATVQSLLEQVLSLQMGIAGQTHQLLIADRLPRVLGFGGHV